MGIAHDSVQGLPEGTPTSKDCHKGAPRLNQLRDSGMLYHCHGEHGTFWNVWKSSLECRIQLQSEAAEVFYADMKIRTIADSLRRLNLSLT